MMTDVKRYLTFSVVGSDPMKVMRFVHQVGREVAGYDEYELMDSEACVRVLVDTVEISVNLIMAFGIYEGKPAGRDKTDGWLLLYTAHDLDSIPTLRAKAPGIMSLARERGVPIMLVAEYSGDQDDTWRQSGIKFAQELGTGYGEVSNEDLTSTVMNCLTALIRDVQLVHKGKPPQLLKNVY